MKGSVTHDNSFEKTREWFKTLNGIKTQQYTGSWRAWKKKVVTDVLLAFNAKGYWLVESVTGMNKSNLKQSCNEEFGILNSSSEEQNWGRIMLNIMIIINNKNNVNWHQLRMGRCVKPTKTFLFLKAPHFSGIWCVSLEVWLLTILTGLSRYCSQQRPHYCYTYSKLSCRRHLLGPCIWSVPPHTSFRGHKRLHLQPSCTFLTIQSP